MFTNIDPEGATGEETGQQFQSLFYNFLYRDKINWSRMHVIKMIYHLPSRIMFIFSDVNSAEVLTKIMRKTYKFEPEPVPEPF